MKEKLCSELDRRVSDNILELTNAELLKKLIANADNDNEAMMIAEMGTTYKRTGLHFDTRLEKMTDDIRYFRKNEQLSFHTDDSKPTHKLVIGDNYEALQNLLIEYKGRVDVIYIDPPYGKDSMGEFAQTNYENAITRDNLLSMLYPRLLLAKQLLSESGVIFCSIDDKNQAYVKCLFDEVFGESNFAGTIIWQSATDNNPSQISTEHEYIICFCRKLQEQGKWFAASKKAFLIEEKYNELKSQFPDVASVQSELRKWIKENEKNLQGVAHYNNVDENGVYSNSSNSSNTKPGGYTFDIVHPITQMPCVKPAFGWRWKEETFLNYVQAGDVEWGKDETTQPHVKKRIDTVVEQFKSIYYEDGRVATKLLESIFNQKKAFDNPKPINLIKKILSYTAKEDNAIILDFFAGSGTTGHAVLELNEKDGGNRQFILCQLNEKTDSTPNGIAYDVTSKRLKRIMTGECYDGIADFDWIKKNKPYGGNLDVYEIGSVANFEATEGKTPFDVIDETLYGKEKFQTLREKIEWVCSNFNNAQKVVESATEWIKRTTEE
ncbi:MAG: site-specific DNA-methyltransferase [Bacteroidales bacterium]|nr:site-specific DNA-methyltransferase [Bacteroidales bacterium]